MAEAKRTPQIIAALSAACGAMACGAVIGWSAPVQDELENSKDYGFMLTADEFSWVSSLMTLGAATACIPTGILISYLGRKLIMLLMLIPFCTGWVVLIFATNAGMMMIARFLLGFAGGSFFITAPIYATEIAQKEIRGITGSFFGMLSTTGVLISYSMGTIVDCLGLNIICATIPLIFGVIFFFMPGSPVYLIRVGDKQGAKESMKRLRGSDYDATGELNEMHENDQKYKARDETLFTALKRRTTLKSLGLSASLMVLQQFGGVLAIIFYSTDIFASAGVDLSTTVCTLLVGILLVITSFVSLFLIDRFGRVPLLMVSAIFQALTTLMLGIYFYMQDNDEKSVESITWLAIVNIALFIMMFAIGFGPVPWVFMAEIFADDVKDIGSALVVTINWLCAFVVTKYYLFMRDELGAGPVYWFFAGVSILALIHVILFVPETKGKSFAEIQDILEGQHEGKK